MDTNVPEVRVNYAFCRKQDEDQVATLLVLKHRQPWAVRWWVVPHKGGLEVAATEITARGIQESGSTGDALLKSDKGGATNALRH